MDERPNGSITQREWREYLMKRLDKIEDSQIELLKAVEALKVKAGVWGLLGGAIPAIVLFIYWLAQK